MEGERRVHVRSLGLTGSGVDGVRGTEVDLLGPSSPALNMQMPVGLSQRVWVHRHLSTSTGHTMLLLFPSWRSLRAWWSPTIANFPSLSLTAHHYPFSLTAIYHPFHNWIKFFMKISLLLFVNLENTTLNYRSNIEWISIHV